MARSRNTTKLAHAEATALDDLSTAFRAPLERHFSRRLADRNDIEDMVQEVFLRLIQRGDVANLANLNGYVFRIAHNVFNDRMRRWHARAVGSHLPFDEQHHGDVDFSAEHVLLNREQLATATTILLELPERTRVIFILRRLEGLRYRDISARLGISVSAVEKHMERAVIHLAQRLDQH